jgi:hypothetical protein
MSSPVVKNGVEKSHWYSTAGTGDILKKQNGVRSGWENHGKDADCASREESR